MKRALTLIHRPSGQVIDTANGYAPLMEVAVRDYHARLGMKVVTPQWPKVTRPAIILRDYLVVDQMIPDDGIPTLFN